LWLGFEQAYIGADFTRSFVTCTKGINYVGYTMICYGVTDVIGSYLFGSLAKYLGRITCIMIGAVLNFSMIFLMLFWQPNNEQIYVLFIIPVCWGLADAAWQTQINSVYGILFPDTHEEAFSNFRLWESIGFAVAYAYSNFICTSFKLYLLLGYLIFGVACFLIIELMQLIEKKRKITYKL
jgi:predicted MFS family arabinose efflux permease